MKVETTTSQANVEDRSSKLIERAVCTFLAGAICLVPIFGLTSSDNAERARTREAVAPAHLEGFRQVTQQLSELTTTPAPSTMRLWLIGLTKSETESVSFRGAKPSIVWRVRQSALGVNNSNRWDVWADVEHGPKGNRVGYRSNLVPVEWYPSNGTDVGAVVESGTPPLYRLPEYASRRWSVVPDRPEDNRPALGYVTLNPESKDKQTFRLIAE